MKGPSRHILLTFAALLLQTFGCDDQQPIICPGTPIGEFVIEVAPVSGASSCGFEPEARSTRVMLSWDSDETGSATLCPSNSNAARLTGEHSGDHVTISSTAMGAPVETCGSACTATIDQRLEFDLVRDNGNIAGLTGTLVESLSTPRDCTEETSEVVCTLPCEVRFTLVGAQ